VRHKSQFGVEIGSSGPASQGAGFPGMGMVMEAPAGMNGLSGPIISLEEDLE